MPLPGCARVGGIAAILIFGACERKPAPVVGEVPHVESAATPGAEAAVPAAQPAPPAPPPVAEIWKEFSGERAFAHVKTQVEIGPRPSGSPEIEKARTHIAEELTALGWKVERQELTDPTPRGPIAFVNLLARFGGSATTQRALVASHYDTKRFSTIRFVGANDAGSSTGALLELARVLALDHALAAQIELVFFDGEEALEQFTETDGLYGSRHYARTLRDSGRARQFRFGILWDMIGDADLTITLPPDSPAEVTRELLASADALGLRAHFSYHTMPFLDDHVPLNRIGLPTVDVIDFDYFAWHSADDRLEKLSPASLQKIGAVTLHHLRHTLAK